MKKKLIRACAFFSCLLLCTACTDTIFSSMFGGDNVAIEIDLNIPGESSAATRAIKTRVGGENQYDNHTDDYTELQRYIGKGDYYVLIFEDVAVTGGPEWSLYAVPDISSISGNNGDATRTLTAVMKKPDEEKTIIVDVVTNLVENGVYESTSAAKYALTNMLGQSRENVYAAIGSFTCPENSEENPYGVWTLDATSGGRYLPMWGQSYNSTTMALQDYTITPSTSELYVTCGLYRSVAKIGVTVDADCQTFQLKEIYVYYPNNEGTFVSLPVESGDNTNWKADKTVQFTLPEVPEDATSRTIEYPLAYKLDTALGASGQYLNNIYVAEADNKNNSTNPVCLVVGGYYTGGDYNGEGLSNDEYPLDYYRIDLESLTTDTEGTTTNGAFDIIRNHSYLFNIKNANNPGTSDPDPRRATAGLTVEILDYTEVPMHGINSQYTLNVNQSLFAFEGATTTVGELIISTNGEGWELVTSWTKEDEQGNTTEETTADWVKVTDTLGQVNHTDDGDVVTIEPSANVNTTEIRNTSFYIKCGQIMKRIDVVQDNTETGNSYLVTSAGSYDIKVDIRGNGNTRAWSDDTGNNYEDIDFQMTDSIPDVAYAAIIWETADGFVTIPNPTEISESGCLAYVVNNVSLKEFGDWDGYVFDPGNGANALIGVYDSSNNLLWSYHIWGVGDYANGDLTEEWQTGSTGEAYYSYMDRNLGAYSNLPGSKSFGLLYQWGRKDPFIGAYRENYERDYRQVRRQYTRHYPQQNGKTYLWETFNDSDTTEAEDVKDCIENPTSILMEGLLTSDDSHNTLVAQGLWGTASYNADANELGNKTMYDPCPPGYRVPSLNALTVYDGTHNLWTSGQHSFYSSRFVPVPEGSSYLTNAGYEADFVSDAPFYGFWLDYANQYGFNSLALSDVTNSTDVGYGVTYYDWDASHGGTNCGWINGNVGSKPTTVTWLPMAGILNGTVNHFGRAGLTDVMGAGPGDEGGPPSGEGGGEGGGEGPPSGEGGGEGGGEGPPSGQGGGPAPRRKVAQTPKASGDGMFPASSLQVTSVLWANSPTSNNSSYPGGLLLHGTEGAYAPHYLGEIENEDGTVSEGLVPYYYSPGTVTSTSGTGSGTSDMVNTEGPGYWITEADGYSSIACGWWSGSVDAKSSGLDPKIEQGQWNATSEHEQYIVNNYNSEYWYDENGLNESGRHFHSFIESNASVYANPSYAASVRCIRDKDAIVHTNDTIFIYDEEGELVDYKGETLYLYQYGTGGGTQDVISLAISYIEEWEVVSPGAKWVSINPTSGTTSSSTGAIDAIKITYIESYLPEGASTTNPAEATIIIKTARGTTFSIIIQYVGGTRTS